MKITALIVPLFFASVAQGASGFCNWGPDGTGSSSVCEGGPQGGTWCNNGRGNCENGCGGNWCTSTADQPRTPSTPNAPTPPCGNGWTTASATTYTSYAPCCRDSPNYDPNADRMECDVYSACDYPGDFAYIGHKSFDYVRRNNIVSFFSIYGDNSSFGNKKIRISAQGKTIEAIIADTCGGGDCNGCCSANAAPSGYLVDMEYWTVMNNFGSTSAASGQICWQLVEDASNNDGDGTAGFCNWGPDGSGSSSTCDGGPQGGSWCNANQNQCEAGCGGKWC